MLCVRFDVVAGDDKSPLVFSLCELDSGSRPGGVPGPVGLLGLSGDFTRSGPGESVVGGGGDEDSTCILATLGNNVALVVVSPVPGHEEVHDSRFSIYYRGGIAAGVGCVVPDNLLIAPSFAVVSGAFQEEVDIAGIASSVITTFTESEDGA